jgi:hypothetical protein
MNKRVRRVRRSAVIGLAGLMALQGCALIEAAHYDVTPEAVYWVSYPSTSSNPSFERYVRDIEADPQTFEILAYGDWGKDRLNAYYRGFPIAGADVAAFRPLSAELASDSTWVWNGREIIEGADGASFTLISRRYGVDRVAAYAGWMRFIPCDLSSFTVLESEEETFTADSRCVYAGGLQLPLQDRASFELLGAGYSRDRAGVYWRQFKVTGADPTSFHIPPGTRIGRDRSGCWLGPSSRPCTD